MAQTGLTSFSIAVAARVVRQVGAIVKGVNPTADTSFELVANVLDKMLHGEDHPHKAI